VARDGYLWWYLDVLDPKGGFGLTIIGFVGHVFSPAYARARAEAARLDTPDSPARGVDPERHCALNVALVGPGAHRWVMSEWGPGAVAGGAVVRDARHLRLGASTFAWEGDELVIRLDARTANAQPVDLDADGKHRWYPVAPVATATVKLSAPDLSFDGHAYHDMNQGDGPLERDFARWDWSRSTTASANDTSQPAETTVIYDTVPMSDRPRRWGRRFTADGAWQPVAPEQEIALRETSWQVPRRVRLAAGARVESTRTLLSAPFYNRSWLRLRGADGTPSEAMHECFLGRRFARRWVQFLLPFKMRMEPDRPPAGQLSPPEGGP
jgi:carotenoid 1,2-hydratase